MFNKTNNTYKITIFAMLLLNLNLIYSPSELRARRRNFFTFIKNIIVGKKRNPTVNVSQVPTDFLSDSNQIFRLRINSHEAWHVIQQPISLYK